MVTFMAMHALIRKIHMYVGLLNFTILLVFGITGLNATFEQAPAARPKPDPLVKLEDYTPPPNATDKQVADDIHRSRITGFAHPIPEWALKRDKQKNLQLDFYSPNGMRRIVVLEKENKIRIENNPVGVWDFISRMHATTIRAEAIDWRMRLWTWYTEFSIWSLITMALSGLYLWLASRPSYKWAIVSFAVGSGSFLVLWVLTR